KQTGPTGTQTATTGKQTGPTGTQKQVFQTFNDHVKHLQQARYEQYAGKPGVKVASKAEFEKMKSHLLSLYANLKVKHTFTGKGGNTIDVVDIKHQPSLQNPLLKNHKVQLVAPLPKATPKHPPGKMNYPVKHLPHHLDVGQLNRPVQKSQVSTGTIPL